MTMTGSPLQFPRNYVIVFSQSPLSHARSIYSILRGLAFVSIKASMEIFLDKSN